MRLFPKRGSKAHQPPHLSATSVELFSCLPAGLFLYYESKNQLVRSRFVVQSRCVRRCITLQAEGTWYTDATHIDYIVCPDNIADKIASKRRMTVPEARQVLLSKPRVRFAEKGHIADNNVYAAFG